MEEKKFKLWAAHDKGDSAHTVWLYEEKPTLNATNDGYAFEQIVSRFEVW